MKLLRTINRLKDPRDLRLFLQILAMLVFLPAKIRRQSLPELLEGIDPGVAGKRGSQAKLDKTVGFIDSLLKYRVFLKYGTCLLRTLVLFRFLRLQGWPVEISFGVKKTGEDQTHITGHSWLVFDGKPFLESEQQQGAYATTYHYPG